MRDDSYLKNRLEYIWQNYFSDVQRKDPICIKFGRRAFKRLGSIGVKSDNQIDSYQGTHIRINGHLKDSTVPEYVIDATIAHELCHYVHGFGSSLPKTSEYPHRDGIVEKEFKRRGLNQLAEKEWRWLQNNWKNHLKSCGS